MLKSSSLTPGAIVARLAVIGVLVLIVVVAVAFVGGWLSPDRLTQNRMMQLFHATNGAHPGFRYNHAKGICVSGWFESSGSAASLSKAGVLQPGVRARIIGLFVRASYVPGDPVATAPAILEVVDAADPPLRIFFGSGGLPMIRAEYAQRIETWEKWNPVWTAAQGNLARTA